MDAPERSYELDDLLDRAPVGFVSFRSDGIVVLVNRTLLEMLGYGREEVVGRHIEQLFSVATRIFHQTHLFPLARLHGRADEVFLQLRAKSGEDVGVFANLQRRDEGVELYDVVVMRVKERQKYEEELIRARRAAEEARHIVEEQAAELEATTEELMAANEELVAQTEELQRLSRIADSANRAKSEFLAVMSHELRTPLNAIGGYLQIMELGIHGPLTAEQRDTLERIDRAQRHLLRLINDLLNLSKLESGSVEYHLEDVDVAEVVGAVAPLIEPQVHDRSVTLESRIGEGVVVHADREKLEQIMLNLLSNATKFTPAGGRITLDSLRPADRDGFVALLVIDTGIGIPEDKLEVIFDPFVQVDTGHSRGAQGTGLGLAISRDMARGMGGDLAAASEPGRGSTFTLLLPAA